MYYKHSSQKGFSLPIAIFILVIMALIATAAVSIFTKSLDSVNQEVLSTRAFYSAESGVQQVLGQLFSLNGAAANCAATSSANYTATGLSSCRSSMTCSSTTIGTEIFYNISSTGICSTGSTRAVRQIEMMAKAP